MIEALLFPALAIALLIYCLSSPPEISVLNATLGGDLEAKLWRDVAKPKRAKGRYPSGFI